MHGNTGDALSMAWQRSQTYLCLITRICTPYWSQQATTTVQICTQRPGLQCSQTSFDDRPSNPGSPPTRLSELEIAAEMYVVFPSRNTTLALYHVQACHRFSETLSNRLGQSFGKRTILLTDFMKPDSKCTDHNGYRPASGPGNHGKLTIQQIQRKRHIGLQIRHFLLFSSVHLCILDYPPLMR